MSVPMLAASVLLGIICFLYNAEAHATSISVLRASLTPSHITTKSDLGLFDEKIMLNLDLVVRSDCDCPVGSNGGSLTLYETYQAGARIESTGLIIPHSEELDPIEEGFTFANPITLAKGQKEARRVKIEVSGERLNDFRFDFETAHGQIVTPINVNFLGKGTVDFSFLNPEECKEDGPEDPSFITPEPSTWLLLGTGLVGILSHGWRRKRLNG